MSYIIAYISYPIILIAYLKAVKSFTLLFRTPAEKNYFSVHGTMNPPPGYTVTGILDVLFLGRLFRVNKPLWIGEWGFHVSFILVVLGHLRFIVNYPPRWFYHLVCIGKYAGILLVFSLVYILFVRISNREKPNYLSPRNLLLILHIFSIGATGIILRFFIRTDIISVKEYVMGILSFHPVSFNNGGLFILHFFLFLILVLYLPSHVLVAPFVIVEARKRESNLKLLHYPEEGSDA